LLTNRTPHGSYENTTDIVRWSMDLRYQSASLPTNAKITRLLGEASPQGRTMDDPDFVPVACHPPEANFRIRGRLGKEWQRKIVVDPNDVVGRLAAARLDSKQPVNWFTGRWPYISFLGGMVMGNRSEDLEFFYSEPFQWHSTVLDYVLTGGGKIYGLRAKFHRYKEAPSPKPMCSFLLNIRTDVLLAEYHPSYILANGRRVWDFKRHKTGAGSIQVSFSVEEPSDVTIDLVVDQSYTPDTKGLAFRMFFLNYLGDPGVKLDLAGAETKASGSLADKLRRFVFGLYPSGYDFWTNQGVRFAEIRKRWKPNFRPDYPTDDMALCPFCFKGLAKGKYNDARRILAIDPKLCAFWFRGEGGSAISETEVVRAAKRQAGSEARITAMYEPFPPTLNSYREYERGCRRRAPGGTGGTVGEADSGCKYRHAFAGRVEWALMQRDPGHADILDVDLFATLGDSI
jgi:hypothetical protein